MVLFCGKDSFCQDFREQKSNKHTNSGANYKVSTP